MALIPSTISISEAINDLDSNTSQIRRKSKTLIDYYIYPNPTPSEISAYDPRLAALQKRLATLSKISYPNLAYLLDNSDALAASFLIEIIDQLLNAIHGLEEIFENHYDRFLEERKPFFTVYKVLEHREMQLKGIVQDQMTNPQRLRPEDLRPNEIGYFCRGAIQMTNHRDKGKISYVDRSELLDENRVKMKLFGGAFLWWECPECAFRLRYHVASSARSSIHSTDEVREHTGVGVLYKSKFLVKSHIFQLRMATTRGSRGSISASAKYGCVFCFGLGKSLERGATTFTTGRELAVHMAASHKKSLPPGPMAERFSVAVKGKPAANVNRWEINFK